MNATTPTRRLPKHGSRARYLLERRDGGEACDACRNANTEYSRSYRQGGRLTDAYADVSERIDEIARCLWGPFLK